MSFGGSGFGGGNRFGSNLTKKSDNRPFTFWQQLTLVAVPVFIAHVVPPVIKHALDAFKEKTPPPPQPTPPIANETKP